MILGMSTANYTLAHVIVSLIGIGSGFVVMWGFFREKRLDGITAIFLVSTALTSISGFGFPFEHLLPSHKVGILSLIVLAVAIVARHAFHLEGSWRATYVVTAALALYLNVFVLIAQLFQKVPALKALAPTGTEAPFLGTELTLLLVFIVLTVFASKKFRLVPASAA